jgi:hypothetical protein
MIRFAATETYTCPICGYVTEGENIRTARSCGACHRSKLGELLDWMPTWLLRCGGLCARLTLIVIPSYRRDPEARRNVDALAARIRERRAL